LPLDKKVWALTQKHIILNMSDSKVLRGQCTVRGEGRGPYVQAGRANLGREEVGVVGGGVASRREAKRGGADGTKLGNNSRGDLRRKPPSARGRGR